MIENYMIDNYWLNTSFIKLPMQDSEQIHRDLSLFLAQSLAAIGTIKIIHDDKMIAINKAFVCFVEELEKRVISYDDFCHYKEAYYEDWCSHLEVIFK